MITLPFKKNNFIYLFLGGGEGREKEMERNINLLVASYMQSDQRPNLQPRHVP